MAIKAEELRIGNHTSMGVVYEIHEDCFYIKDKKGHSLKNKWADIQPIPLDESWLLRMGFGKCEEPTLSKNIDKRLSIVYDWHFKMLYMVVTFHDGDELSHAFTHIEHVHELQNFWFFLACEELTIN